MKKPVNKQAKTVNTVCPSNSMPQGSVNKEDTETRENATSYKELEDITRPSVIIGLNKDGKQLRPQFVSRAASNKLYFSYRSADIVQLNTRKYQEDAEHMCGFVVQEMLSNSEPGTLTAYPVWLFMSIDGKYKAEIEIAPIVFEQMKNKVQ